MKKREPLVFYKIVLLYCLSSSCYILTFGSNRSFLFESRFEGLARDGHPWIHPRYQSRRHWTFWLNIVGLIKARQNNTMACIVLIKLQIMVASFQSVLWSLMLSLAVFIYFEMTLS